MTLDNVKNHGIIGAGGAGFPAHIKLGARPEYLIVNAAECEPLLHKDAEIISNHTAAFLKGCRTAQKLCGAASVIIGIKKKNAKAISVLKTLLPSQFRIAELNDFYPAGDEVTLIYKITGRVVAPGALPITCGCVVQNVETLFNIGLEGPVTHKFLSVAGAVKEPVTLRVPVGMAMRDVLLQVLITIPDYALVVNGVMMGYVEDSLDAPVTKRTGGLIVLPRDHFVVRMLLRSRDTRAVDFLARAACDQCSFCTELCPRYLLGHPVRPETAMRNRLMHLSSEERAYAGNAFCCDCNLCTLFACPEQLDPRGACRIEKAMLRGKPAKNSAGTIAPHPMAAFRATPTSRLKKHIGIDRFADHAPLKEIQVRPSRVTIPLLQHAGAPAITCVAQGAAVAAGDLIARANGTISANVHASIDGKVASITKDAITITA